MGGKIGQEHRDTASVANIRFRVTLMAWLEEHQMLGMLNEGRGTCTTGVSSIHDQKL